MNKKSLVVLALVACGFNASPGTGTKIGQVVKLSQVGIFRKTWEAQLIRGGMTSGSGGFGVTPFDFTVESDSLAAVINKYMDDQTEVLIHYRTEGVASCFRTESENHFLVSVTPAPSSHVTGSAP